MSVSATELLVTGNSVMRGNLSIGETSISAQTRDTILKQDAGVLCPIKLTELHVWDAPSSNLPSSASADDLALIPGTFGTNAITVQAGDLKAAGATTRYAGFIYVVKECYDPGETLNFTFSCGMKTTIADTSCTVDIECRKSDKVGGVGSDLCTTSAQSINSLVFADKTFTINPATLAKGDVLQIRVAITCTDAATATAVIPTIANIDAVVDIKG